ncbi:hypothetical protein [Rhodobacter sp. 24-YEA-8]|uniref:hypothetical protein n=1 Tax=Rhodobacter sp. 24-YEA-8 TaxID=1884310 RepID=UPI000898FC5A|nr:hypothetical protein [Rhodobacter sp. 24-YEA-8]SED61616.1 hypothetical protein SAMN05519105_4280 [Rhodobacter sp. 24-YEA-8]
MTKVVLRLTEDVFPAGFTQHAYLPAAARAIYVVEGDVTVEFSDGAQNHQAGGAWLGQSPVALSGGPNGTRLWRWDLVAPDAPGDGRLQSAPGVTSTARLSAELDLDPAQEWLLRCDRVGFPPGGVALTHVHQGPGIRCCLKGEISIETPSGKGTYGPGDPWLEIGHEPVLAPTTESSPTSFIRTFVLPRNCRGRSSIRYVRPEDAAAPKVQDYFVFGERFIDLPG